MNLEINSEVGARFKLVARKSSTEEITRETGWFNNIVLDTGLAQMSVGLWINRCCVGTGNSTPVATQTQLDAFKASTTTTQGAVESGMQLTILPYYDWLRVTYRFGEGVAAGNISEVGLGWANTNMWNRALVKDANGNPTTITVLSDEYLDVITEIRVYPQETLSGSFNFLNKAGAVVSSHTYTGRAYHKAPQHYHTKMGIGSIGIYSGALGSSPTVGPSGSRLDYGSPNTTVYPTPTSIKCTKVFPVAQAIGEHRTLFVESTFLSASSGMGYQVEFTPTITKTNQMELTYTVSMSWGRYTGA
jgi:hypothetical protein